ncbi:MAG: hypothetical protein QOH51_3076 [Acidobacteriota bacterium]|jgi:hypothetical protein|nr:hypothetical protein [Acidobacteriota bacterium]
MLALRLTEHKTFEMAHAAHNVGISSWDTAIKFYFSALWVC